jgi:predicted alpha/beta superfamily hydrolase
VIHRHLFSTSHGDRSVRVWLPDRPPRGVLFLGDGQNVFAARGARRPKWRADEITGRLIAEGRAAPIAIVGIDHSGPVRRWADYLPYSDPRNARARRFDADRYADLVVSEIIPELARAHPQISKARHTGIGGSSYGAIAALHAAARHPRVFDRVLVESAPLWVGDGRLIEDARGIRRGARVWIGIGASESSRPEKSAELVALARRLARTLRARADVRLRIDSGGRHDEDAWAERLPDALRWLFGV